MQERSDYNEKEYESKHQPSPPGARENIGSVGTGKIDRPTRRSNGLLIAVAFFSAILGGLVATFAIPYIYGSTPEAVFSGRQNLPPSDSKNVIHVDKSAVSPVTAVAKKLQPSIVNIGIKQSMGDTFHSNMVSGIGSGVIFRQDGYILTNNHVISGAKEIQVTIGTDKVRGKLVAADRETDLAVIKVNRTGLPAAEFGSTKGLQVGELAVAIGSPFGFEHTVTSGIISALNRTVSVPDEDRPNENTTYANLIQTDAPINPGNSGGALSDAKGRIIGINTLIISSSGVTEGVGFAIPVEVAKDVAEQLIENGKASHPYMGIGGRDVEDVVTDAAITNTQHGAVITEVKPGSPADKAGLVKNDVIIAVGGQKIGDMDELIAAVRQREVGDTIEITYLRGAKRRVTELTLVEKPRR
ncbi:MAG TPA: trypsin-like peptidase domain-containing protein [Anaerolineae bacterium]|jgi:S1-C subfamily serine protease|nr:trypsin-like peptidase domain-containing protein [Anaerolineae bacterium]